jgi:SAM-dependent methyltransferase
VEETERQGWGERYGLRLQVRQRYPDIWAVPVVRKPQTLLGQLVKGRRAVLDVGAHRRGLAGWFQAHAPWMRYRSLDVDRAWSHDYYDWDEVHETFDLVVMLEVVEHLDLGSGEALMRRARGVLETGGSVVLSTPNPQHPTRYFMDSSHQVPYGYEELGALILRTGLRLGAIYRVFNAAFLPRILRLSLGIWLHRYLGIDFAPSLLALGDKT